MDPFDSNSSAAGKQSERVIAASQELAVSKQQGQLRTCGALAASSLEVVTFNPRAYVEWRGGREWLSVTSSVR